MRLQMILLLAIFAAGFAILSITFHSTQNPTGSDLPPNFCPDPKNLCDNSLTERQRAYLDRLTDVNKWLIALGYGTLVGLITKRTASNDDLRFNSFACSLGGILLILSLYAGFLSYQSILIALSLKPLSAIGSNLTAFPISAQMILLLLATTVLAYAFLRPNVTRASTDTAESAAKKSSDEAKA